MGRASRIVTITGVGTGVLAPRSASPLLRKGGQIKSLAQARVKRVRAVQLLAKGKSYDEIARAVSFSHRGSAHRAVHKALVEREVEAVAEFRMVELAGSMGCRRRCGGPPWRGISQPSP